MMKVHLGKHLDFTTKPLTSTTHLDGSPHRSEARAVSHPEPERWGAALQIP
jgi:hypothetical protein